MFVLDTNIVIAYFAEEKKVVDALETALADGEAIILPTIVKAETLSYPLIDTTTLTRMRGWFEGAELAVLDGQIAEQAAEIRRTTGLKLIDSIIAATAFALNAKLISRDQDFKRVPELEVITW